VEGNNVKLNWNTGDEVNFSHFNLLRSMDGRSFENIKRITSPGQNSYTYIDINAASLYGGRLFYRLQMVDTDGSFVYSNIIIITPGEKGPELLVSRTLLETGYW
jgi:trimeric autotransporter adhesin